MIGKKTVRGDLLGLSAMAILVLCFVLGIFGLKAGVDTRAKNYLAVDNALVKSIDQIQIYFLRARSAEKYFLLRKDEKYLKTHAAVTEELHHEIDVLADAARLHGPEEALRNSEALHGFISKYAQQFQSLAELNVKIGLAPDVGLEGVLRSAVHDIETILADLNSPEMQVKMLMMRRHEKDFIMRRQQKYIDRLNTRVAEFRDFPMEYYRSPENQSEVLSRLEEYQTAFNSFAAASFEESSARLLVSNTFAEAEPIFESVQVAVQNQMDADQVQFARLNLMILVGSAVAIVIAMALFLRRILKISRRIADPLQETAEAIDQLSAGNLDVEPPHSSYGEITKIADAFQVFRQNITDSRRLEQERREISEKAREAAEIKTAEVEAARQEAEVARNFHAKKSAVADAFFVAFSRVVAHAEQGGFDERVGTRFDDEDYDALSLAVNKMMEKIESGIWETQQVVGDLAAGRLGTQMTGDYEGAFATLQRDINTTAERLRSVVENISSASNSIISEVSDLSSNAESLAGRSAQQANVLGKTGSSITHVTETIVNNVTGAEKVESDAVEAAQKAMSGRDVMNDAVRAMDDIQASAGKVTKIVDVIDDISFQTNLLALNAGVEAARAGAAGRGFAVVAHEVRELALRASTAAQDIGQLIEESSRHVSEGARLVDTTGEMLNDIVGAVEAVGVTASEIAASSHEQSRNMQDVASSVKSIGAETQENVQIAQQNSAAVEQLNGQAARLEDLIGFFCDEDGNLKEGRNLERAERASEWSAATSVERRSEPHVGADIKSAKNDVVLFDDDMQSEKDAAARKSA